MRQRQWPSQRRYGYDHSKDQNVSVTASNAVACPSGTGTCYSVVISGYARLLFAPIVGFTGNLTVNGARAVAVSASAVASKTTRYCVVALGSVGTDFTSNGGPKADLSGCSIFANSDAVCHGHDLNADVGNAHGTNDGCGIVRNSNLPLLTDPYSGLAFSIPGNSCASYPQEPTKRQDPPLPDTNIWGGSKTLSGTNIICGDLKLSGDVSLTSNGNGAVLVIENGQLDTNGHTLRTLANSHLTVVFSGTNSGGYTHAPTGGGTLDFAAPVSGDWAGVAIYQDPSLTNGIDISAAGNSPTWDITGLVYLPKSNVTFSGAVNKSSNGSSCFVLVVNNITINGTGSILAHGGCNNAGLTMPSTRGQLVS